MVGGEAVPKTGADAVKHAQCDGAASAGAGEAQSAPMTESAPVDAFNVAPEQSVWEAKSKGEPGYVKYSDMKSGIEVPLNDIGASELLTSQEFLDSKTTMLDAAERKAFELLFKENANATEGKKLSAFELDKAYESTLEQFSRMRATSIANGVPLENLPKIVEAGLAEGFDAYRIPREFERVMEPKFQLKVAMEVEQKLTKEKAVEVMAELDRAKAAEVAKPKDLINARSKGVMVSAGIGGGVWWASLKVADSIGIENPTLHFGFVVYTMDSSMAAGQAARGVVAARMGGSTWGAAFKASSVPELFAGRTIAARLLTFTRKGILAPPKNAMLHIGPGLLWCQMGGAITRAVGTIGDYDPEAVGEASLYISTGGFFLPGMIVEAAGGSATPAVMGVGLAADIAVAAMVAEVLVEGGQELFDSEYDYRLSLEARAEERYLEYTQEKQFEALDMLPEHMYNKGFVAFASMRTLEDFVGVFAPNMMRRLRASSYHFVKGNGLSDTIGGDEFWVKDWENSKEVRKELPGKLRKSLGGGINGQADSPEFYNEVSFEWMDEKLKVEDNVAAKYFDEDIEKYRETPNYKAVPKEKRLQAEMNYIIGALGSEEELQEAVTFKQAMHIQQNLISLRVMNLIEGDPIREIMGEEGDIAEGKEDAFLMEYVASAYDDLGPDATADDVRERVLEDRKVNLVRRILTAEAEYDSVPEDLMDLADGVGLVGADGNLQDGEIYRSAVEGLAHDAVFTQDEEFKDTLEYHSAKTIEEGMRLSGKADLSHEEAERLEKLGEMDSFMRARVEEEKEEKDKVVRMAAANILVQNFVDARDKTIEKSNELKGNLDKLELDAEERKEIDERYSMLLQHASMPKPPSVPEDYVFSAKVGTWVAPKKIGR